MSADTYQRVYAYVYAYRLASTHMPSPREVYEALGITKRQYVVVLRWLLRHRFIARPRTAWRFAKLNTRTCACGAELTPDNTVFVDGAGYVYTRRPCRSCFNARGLVQKHAFRAANPGYEARAVQRRREQKRLVARVGGAAAQQKERRDVRS